MEAPIFLGPPHPRHGVHAPTLGTPPRVPNSVRRTVTTDMLRPEGIHGRLVLTGHGRDLRTDSDGTPIEIGQASYRALVDYTGDGSLLELSTVPDRPALRALVGTSVRSRFRARLREADALLPNLLHQLLDDLPVTTLVSGHACNAAWESESVRPTGHLASGRDMCAGFADGGTIMTGIDAYGRAPVVTGPAAPPLTSDDPWAWHPLPALPPHGMRRHRRLDVRETAVDVLLRDSYTRPDGLETVIHEYTLAVEIRGEHVHSCEATPRVLPWLECPAAAASARRLAGMPLAGLRRHVRTTFTGTSTCTHLNDTLRALEDVPFLLEAIDRKASDG